MAVVASLELHDPVASSESACEADRRHDGLGAGVRHADLLHGGHHAADGLGHLDLKGIRDSEAGAVFGGRGDRIDHDLRGVTEDRRSPGTDKVDVIAPIDIGDGAPLGLVDEEGLTTHTTESADGGIHAAGNSAERPIPQGVGGGRRRLKAKG